MHIFYITFLIAFNFLYSQIQVQKITDLLDKPIYATSIMLDVETIFIVEQDGIIKIIKDSKLNESILFLLVISSDPNKVNEVIESITNRVTPSSSTISSKAPRRASISLAV